MQTVEETYEILLRQLSSFWPISTEEKKMLTENIADAITKTIDSYNKSNRIYYLKTGFSVYNTTVYTVFLYYLSHILGSRGGAALADKIYYLNKIMNGVEWYWNIELPEHFIVEHPVSSVLGRAQYGDYFCIYQGVTVGANYNDKECIWPHIGDYVTMYANATVIGNSIIGNNVIIGANAFVFDEVIPDNCICVGSSPNLKIKQMTEEEIKKRLVRIWNFETM